MARKHDRMDAVNAVEAAAQAERFAASEAARAEAAAIRAEIPAPVLTPEQCEAMAHLGEGILDPQVYAQVRQYHAKVVAGVAHLGPGILDAA